MKSVLILLINAYRKPRYKSPCDVSDDVITTENNFPGIIGDEFSSHVWFQMEAMFNILTFFNVFYSQLILPELIPYVAYIINSILDIWGFWWILCLKYVFI